MSTRPVSLQLAQEFGLNAEEYGRVLAIMGRTPSLTELGIFSVMWSEHCSYKSSRVWLKQLPTTAPWVIHGPGENAGVVDIGDGLAAIFKMESHNHPSFIEPYQGAATGVGGILRDVFTMGARPIANLNALRFGAPSTRDPARGGRRGARHRRLRQLRRRAHGRRRGELPPGLRRQPAGQRHDGRHRPHGPHLPVAAAGIGNPVVYVGSKTGRDGIHGATMASAEFGADSADKRPTVQVGDPFTEKLLIEACLELMATDAIVAIQDMGAAGLTSSSVEMAGKGGVGIELDLDTVPQRETGMSAYEMMLSESQERMLMVLRPDREAMARAIFEKWELDFAVIGHLTDTGRIVVRIAAASRPTSRWTRWPTRRRCTTAPPAHAAAAAARRVTDPVGLTQALLTLIACPDLCSPRLDLRPVRQHDRRPDREAPGAADAAVVRIEGQQRALALTTDCTPRYCAADPRAGGVQAVAEAWRNLTATGARPLAITDNMNFGNPEKPEIMGQFAAAIAGMAAACRALDFPVVSGNVSLYNETAGHRASCPPPPSAAWACWTTRRRRSAWRCRRARPGADRPHRGLARPVALAAGDRRPRGRAAAAGGPGRRTPQRRLRAGADPGRARRRLPRLSDGGLLVAAAEMALAGDVGLHLAPPPDCRRMPSGSARTRPAIVLAVADAGALLAEAAAAGVPARASAAPRRPV